MTDTPVRKAAKDDVAIASGRRSPCPRRAHERLRAWRGTRLRRLCLRRAASCRFVSRATSDAAAPAPRESTVLLIPPIYHWSPRSRLGSIRRRGLVPGCAPTIGTISTVHDEVHVLCFSTDPWYAWRLSGDMGWVPEGTTWDLWQTEVASTDAVHIRAEYGPRIMEVRIANRIPKSRLHWIAERSTLRAVPQ